MALMPKRVKFRKTQRGKVRGASYRGATLAFGEFGLKALESCYFTDRQIEAARVALMRNLKGTGKVWIRVFPDKPVTFKGAEVGMGGGKGGVDHYVYAIRPGRIIFEIDGLKEDVAREALAGAGNKLPIKTKFVKKDNI